jgi:riboflavin kinase/FMN adenylyltransferase
MLPFVPFHHGLLPHPSWRGCAVALGNFDGVHLGHHQLLESLRDMARRHHQKALAVTFFPHPAEVLANKMPRRLMSLDERVQSLLAAGTDGVWVQPFTRELAKVSGRTYIEETLLRQLAMCGFVAGPDTRFGAGREGGAELLAQYARRTGFDLVQLAPFEVNGHRVSSSAIRQAIEAGDLAQATAWLGRPYRLKGRVVKGMQVGRKLGFPTANLEVGRDILVPAKGIYVVRVRFGDQPLDATAYQGVANVGTRPTLEDGHLMVEAHLFDLSRDLYGQPMTIELLKRLRDEKKYDTVEELVAAIRDDVANARMYFAEHR